MACPSALDLLAQLRLDADDSSIIEAKRAADGWPQDILPTLSAFSNHTRRRTDPIITLILEQDRLVLSNPGGLYGISRQSLGKQGVTSARNGTLIRVCQNVRFSGDLRVCEALASGIPTVYAAVRRAQMTPPAFFDQGIYFTVSMPNHALLAREELDWLTTLGSRAVGLSDIQRHALVVMRRGTHFTNSSFRRQFPMDSRDARRELAGLVDRGLAIAEGERGTRTYRITADARPSSATRTSAIAAQIGAQLDDRPKSIAELAGATGLTRRQIDYALRKMREAGEVRIVEGGRGKRTTYGRGNSLF